ncbi:hypothetical protein SAMN05421505_13716 [Sinosporangium album]|uniref:Uncharacterized protein n=1 Tax=Sinosporangium album TaxID=504805 RepID=A0A1G8IFY9_9ACTN|nr:hypothetical protein SAMN05421505_13716 [Sinosporangium album]
MWSHGQRREILRLAAAGSAVPSAHASHRGAGPPSSLASAAAARLAGVRRQEERRVLRDGPNAVLDAFHIAGGVALMSSIQSSFCFSGTLIWHWSNQVHVTARAFAGAFVGFCRNRPERRFTPGASGVRGGSSSFPTGFSGSILAVFGDGRREKVKSVKSDGSAGAAMIIAHCSSEGRTGLIACLRGENSRCRPARGGACGRPSGPACPAAGRPGSAAAVRRGRCVHRGRAGGRGPRAGTARPAVSRRVLGLGTAVAARGPIDPEKRLNSCSVCPWGNPCGIPFRGLRATAMRSFCANRNGLHHSLPARLTVLGVTPYSPP